MESVISLSTTTAIPAYLVNFTSQPFVTSVPTNSSRSSQLTLSGETTTKAGFDSMAAAAPIGRGASGTWNVQAGSVPSATGTGVSGTAPAGVGATGEEEDVFGEHYFHICIYIWVFVVVSSLIALSVKWGCCGRSLTRWEVKKLPLRKFHRTEGDECHDKCPICHESFHEGRLIRQLPCNHCYHSYCVDRWLVKMSNRCPLCKQRVSISLFCPWSKDRRNKGGGGGVGGLERFSMAELESEAPVDEAPPVPPLSTLTPNNWYGEDIMSGPSKFVIMRPGRPTRVIDMREQNKGSKTEEDDCEGLETAAEEGSLSGCSGGGNSPSPTCGSFSKSQAALATDKESPGGSSVAVMSAPSASPSLCDHNHCSYHHHHIEQHQHHHIVDEVHKSPPSNRSSRSCSVSSDLPLLSSVSGAHCQTCGEEGRQESSPAQCFCQARKEENSKDTHPSIPLATTRISATAELTQCQLARNESLPSAVRHLQVISLHNQEPVPCPNQQLTDGEDSNPATGCACGIGSSLSSLADRSSWPLSVPDETTVCLSSVSSSVLTSSSRNLDRVICSRLSLPHHLVRHNSSPAQPDEEEITSMSLDMLPGHRHHALAHHRHTVVETPITYLGSELKGERKSKDRSCKETRKSWKEEVDCSVEAIAPLSCHGLLPPELLEKHQHTFSNLESVCAAPAEQGLSDLKHVSSYTAREPRTAWQDYSANEPAIQSLPSDSIYQFDSVLTSLPASPALYSKHTPPPPPRRLHRRSNDYTCKHL